MRKLIDPAKAAAVDKIEQDQREAEQAASLSARKEPPRGGVSLDELIDKSLTILYRETMELLMESSKGKLSKDNAACVRDNLKLLKELKEKEKELIDNLTDDELARITGE